MCARAHAWDTAVFSYSDVPVEAPECDVYTHTPLTVTLFCARARVYFYPAAPPGVQCEACLLSEVGMLAAVVQSEGECDGDDDTTDHDER